MGTIIIVKIQIIMMISLNTPENTLILSNLVVNHDVSYRGYSTTFHISLYGNKWIYIGLCCIDVELFLSEFRVKTAPYTASICG